jgi:Spy/CpxP family protein refolding chaperone
MRAPTALSFLAVLSFAAPALAEAPANTIMKVTPPGEAKPAGNGAIDPAVACVHKYQLQLAEMGQLADALKLTDAQKPLFQAWRKTRLDLFHDVPCPSPPMGFDVPAPKRVENQMTMMSATLEGLRKELPATQRLYAALTPEQRAIFDGPIRTPLVPGGGERPMPPHPAH